MLYQRLLNKEEKPSKEEIVKTIGKNSSLWLELHNYIEENYDFTPELTFFTKKHGWTVRYRKSGKTLCYFFPEKGAFSVLLVLGKKESEKLDLNKNKLKANFKSVFETTEQLHDGRWLWIRALTRKDIKSIMLLLEAKRKTKK